MNSNAVSTFFGKRQSRMRISKDLDIIPEQEEETSSCSEISPPSSPNAAFKLVKHRRRHAVLKLSDIKVAKDIIPHDGTLPTINIEHAFLPTSPPRRAPKPPGSPTMFTPDSLNVELPGIETHFGGCHPPLPTRATSPAPSLSNSVDSHSTASPRRDVDALPTTPTSSDDESPINQGRSTLQRRRSIRPLHIVKATNASTGTFSLPHELLQPFKTEQELPTPTWLEDEDEDNEKDAESLFEASTFYASHFSSYLPTQRDQTTRPARPESIAFSIPTRKRSRMSKPLPEIPFALPSPQLDPCFPCVLNPPASPSPGLPESRVPMVRVARPAVNSPIPAHLLVRARASMRPPPRTPLPFDVDEDEDYDEQDQSDTASVYSQDTFAERPTKVVRFDEREEAGDDAVEQVAQEDKGEENATPERTLKSKWSSSTLDSVAAPTPSPSARLKLYLASPLKARSHAHSLSIPLSPPFRRAKVALPVSPDTPSTARFVNNFHSRSASAIPSPASPFPSPFSSPSSSPGKTVRRSGSRSSARSDSSATSFESTGSAGLRRKPIPVSMFLRA